MASESAMKAAIELIRNNTFGWPESEGMEELSGDQERHAQAIAEALDTFHLTQSSDTRPPRNVAPLVERNGRLCAPVGCVVDEEGVVRKVLGTLPVTKDGCVVGMDAKVYWHEDPFEESVDCQSGSAFFEDHGHDASGEVCGAWEKVSACYSTRAAAATATECGSPGCGLNGHLCGICTDGGNACECAKCKDAARGGGA